MKKLMTAVIAATSLLVITSCGGKESAASIAQKWCDLNGKYYKAAEGPEKDAAKAAREEYERDMEKKYKSDEKFMSEIGKEVEKCEDASEGR